MNYKLRSGIDIDEVRRKGREFKGNRLAFAKYMQTVSVDVEGDETFLNFYRYPFKNGEDFNGGENTVIGGCGFGFVRDEDGTWLEIPHVGGVEIGNNVRIGSNCCIDRGTIDDTIIGDGTKIDNMVHIAHNCKIGKNVIICAGVTFCGSVTVEDDVWLAPGTLIKEGVTIGKGAKTGLGAVVIEDVKPGALVYGCPAKERILLFSHLYIHSCLSLSAFPIRLGSIAAYAEFDIAFFR